MLNDGVRVYIELPAEHRTRWLAPRVAGTGPDLTGHYGFALELYASGQVLVLWDEPPGEGDRLVTRAHASDLTFIQPSSERGAI